MIPPQLRIGSVVVAPPVILAPMAGITGWPFRVLCREAGCGLTVTEMVSANALAMGNRRTREMLDLTGDLRPVAVQLFGASPSAMAEAARFAADRGADLIDVNMGCTVPKVARNGAGAALLREPARACEIVAAMAAAVSTPVTVKIRRVPRSTGVETAALARMLEEAGAAAITVHPRSVRGKFEGSLDWSEVAAVKAAVRIPVIGNGGVRTPQDLETVFAATGCDAVMIGRAALGRPWIFREMADYLRTGATPAAPSLETRLATASRHGRMLVEERGEVRAVREMRKHLMWYTRDLPGARAVRRRIAAISVWADLEAVLATWTDGAAV